MLSPPAATCALFYPLGMTIPFSHTTQHRGDRTDQSTQWYARMAKEMDTKVEKESLPVLRLEDRSSIPHPAISSFAVTCFMLLQEQ